jgi:CHAT domain-containing protein/Flp pilus assembly protein TadD
MNLANQASALLESGNYDAAKEIFQQAYKFEQQNPQILFGLGLSYYWLGEYEKSIEFLTQALELQKEYYPLACVWLGWAYKKKNYQNLSDHYLNLVINNDDLTNDVDFEHLLGKGLAFYGLEEYKNAIKYFKQATELKPDSYDAWLYYGKSLYKAEIYDEIKTLEIFEKAIEIQPDYPFAYREKGRLYTKSGEWEKAIYFFNEAIQRKEDFHQAISNRGITLANLSKFIRNKFKTEAFQQDKEDTEVVEAQVNKNQIQAKIDCEKAINLRPKEPELWRNQGIMLSILEDSSRAIDSCNEAIDIKSDYYEAYYIRGFAKFYLSKTSKNNLEKENYKNSAIDDFNQAIKLNQNYAEAYYGLGRIEYEFGNTSQALENFENAIRLKRDYAEAYYGQGITEQKLGKLQQALNNIEKAVRIKPNVSDFLNKYKEIIKSLIKKPRKNYYSWIWNTCKQTVKLYPQDAELYYFWGQAQLNLGEYRKAQYTFQNAIKRNKYYAEAYKGNADALIGEDDNLGEKRYYYNAINAYKEAVKIQPKYWSAWNNLGWSYWEIKNYNEAYDSWKKGLHNLSIEENIKRSISQRFECKKGLIELNLSIGKAKQIAGLWEQAQTYYEKALEIYSNEPQPQLREMYLTALEKYIALCQYRRSKSTSEIDNLLKDGSELLGRFLVAVEKKQGEYKKRCLQRRFATFDQLRVDQLVQNNQIDEALKESEKRKSICLSWLTKEKLDRESEQETQEIDEYLENFNKLVDEKTSVIYWHVSPAAITTFIFRHRQPIIVFSGKINTDNYFEAGLAAEQLLRFERWMRGWKRNYRIYRLEDKIQNKQTHDWRQSMESNLDRLAEILDIEGIIGKLGNNIKQLILIPHRDLHLLPLHYLFHKTDFTITYLPSAKIGSKLQSFSAINSVLNLLPNSKMRYALIQGKVISILYPPQAIESSNTTKNEVLNMFPGDTNSFQFNGHGTHNVENPDKSALLLGGNNKLTLADILTTIDMKGYELVTLAACETGITSKQNLMDEYVGLVSGFLKKGANHVVSSLWKVDERATALLMIKFYELLKEGKNPAVALKLAQKWLREELTNQDLLNWYYSLAEKLEKNGYGHESDMVATWANTANQENNQVDLPFAHPYYWAAFTLTGRPPITL